MSAQLGLNLITLKGERGDGKLEERIRVAADARFEYVGLWDADLVRWEEEHGNLESLRDTLHDLNLSVAEICAVTVCDGEREVASRREEFRRAAAVGSECMICIYNNPGAPMKTARQQWSEFVERVGEFGVRPALEFIGSSKAYNTIDSALDVVTAGPPLGGLLVDTYHFWRGHSKIGTLARVQPNQLALVHLNDVKNVPREDATDKDRTYPGQGIMPLTHILSTILGTGYEGVFDVEIFGECQLLNPVEVARASFQSAGGAIERANAHRK